LSSARKSRRETRRTTVGAIAEAVSNRRGVAAKQDSPNTSPSL
jgi:hypothetical protein